MTSISQILGYPDDTQEPVISSSRAERVAFLISQYESIEQTLWEIKAETLGLVKVDTIEFNHNLSINTMHQRLYAIVEELSRLSGLSVLAYPFPCSPLTVTSYW